MAAEAQEIKPGDVRGLKHLQKLLPLFARLHEVGCERDKAGNRQLHFDDYCMHVMLYLFNPLVDSLACLRHVSGLPNVAAKLGLGRFSMGSFSEAPAVFEPGLLKPIIAELAGELHPLAKDPRLADLKHVLTLVDGTVLSGLARLARAALADTRCSTSRDGREVHGFRLHTQLELETFAPHRVDRTGARNAGESRENNVLRRTLEPGRCYVGDGTYADRTLCDDVVGHDSSYVFRTREDTVFAVVEERLLSREALDAGVVRDAVVRLGGEGAAPMSHAVRLVEVQVPRHPRRRRGGVEQTDRLLIITCLLDLPPELVGLIYRYRYSVELFFRFFKNLLGMRHLLSQRPEGAEIQTYCAVVACMLINLWTARRPGKRTVEMLGWYLLGLATEQDVIDHLNRPDNRGVKLRAKEELWEKLGVK